MFSHLHLVTSDHLDTVVFDPHGDHHPLDDEDVEREVPQQDDSSDQTVGREEREGLSTGPGKDVSNQAEKGQFRRRNRSTTETGQQSRNPETRKWKDDIITFDSRDDPANPKNWPYRLVMTHHSLCHHILTLAFILIEFENDADKKTQQPQGFCHRPVWYDYHVFDFCIFRFLAGIAIYCKTIWHIIRGFSPGYFSVRTGLRSWCVAALPKGILFNAFSC